MMIGMKIRYIQIKQRMGGKGSVALNEDINLKHYKIPVAKASQSGLNPEMMAKFAIEEVRYKEWQNRVKDCKAESNFLLLPLAESYSRSGMCGDHGFVEVTYPRSELLLSAQIEERRINERQFEEHDLWYLLYILAGAQKEMKQKFGSKLGDVRPENIFLSSAGEGVVGNFNSWPGFNSTYEVVRDLSASLLSPEEMHNLAIGGTQTADDYDSQVFSIGLTVLSAATLENYNSLYNYKNCTFKYEEAQFAINAWRQNKVYSPIFTGFVSALCSLDPEKRVTERQLWYFIEEYEKEIKSHENFIIYKVPATVQKEMDVLRSIALNGGSNFSQPPKPIPSYNNHMGNELPQTYYH